VLSVPIDKIFSAGSLAKAYVEIAEWYGKHTLDMNAKSILVPFSGFGRMASAMCTDETSMTVCDFQHLHTCIIEGVFMAPFYATNVDKPHFTKGAVYAGKLHIRNMDQYSAGFFDWVLAHGTTLDVACAAMAIPSQTMRGWMSNWTTNFDSYYTKFEKIREQCREYIPMPGHWQCQEEDFFNSPIRHWRYDCVAIDPPRLSNGPTGKDAYTTGSWLRLNRVLGGTQSPKPWTPKNYFANLHRAMQVDSDYVLFSWTEGQPDLALIKDLVLSYGTLEDEAHVNAFQKSIYSWRIKKEQK
jgi:hypothetical protein